MSTAKSSNKSKQKNNTVSETTICLTGEDLKEIQKHLHAVITKHTDGLVTSISNQFK